jgi:hypothetical protein
MNTNDNYQAPYSIVAYTNPIPLPSSLTGFLPPEYGGFSYETPLQFPFRLQPVEMTPARDTNEPCADPNNLMTQLTTILRVPFGIEPKGREHVYQKPYPNYYGQLPYPRGYRVPKLSKFSGEDEKTTLEHVGQFILQCGEASANDVLKLRIFPLS